MTAQNSQFLGEKRADASQAFTNISDFQQRLTLGKASAHQEHRCQQGREMTGIIGGFELGAQFLIRRQRIEQLTGAFTRLLRVRGKVWIVSAIRQSAHQGAEIRFALRHPLDGNPFERLQRNAERPVVQAHQAMDPRRRANRVALFRVVVALGADCNDAASGHCIINQANRCRTTHCHWHDAGRKRHNAAQHEERHVNRRIV